MEKLTLNDIKKMNYSDVYRYIYQHGTTSKPGLATALRISLPTATQHLNTLLENGLIAKTGQLNSQIGRKAIAYSVVVDARVAIGVEILSKVTYLVSIDLTGHVTARKKLALTYSNSEDYRRTLCESITAFIDELPYEKERILGVGFGLQGLISNDGSEVSYGRTLNFTGLKRADFQKYLDVSCILVHDAECAAISELWENPELSDAVYLSLGNHLGGAIILDGKIRRGRAGRAGTMEHIPLVPDGKLCYCGQRGCAECYCSGYALLEGTETLEEFFAAKNSGEPAHLARWAQFLNDLSQFIHYQYRALDSLVVLGGHVASYMRQEDIIALHEKIQKASAFPEKEPFILLGKCRVDAVCIGAALPLVKQFLESI